MLFSLLMILNFPLLALHGILFPLSCSPSFTRAHGLHPLTLTAAADAWMNEWWCDLITFSLLYPEATDVSTRKTRKMHALCSAIWLSLENIYAYSEWSSIRLYLQEAVNEADFACSCAQQQEEVKRRGKSGKVTTWCHDTINGENECVCGL